jgi:hypothetical protein
MVQCLGSGSGFNQVSGSSVADPDTEPDPEGSETFDRIQIRSGTEINGAQTKHIGMKRIGMKPIATKPIDIKGIGYKTYRNYRYRYIKHIAGFRLLNLSEQNLSLYKTYSMIKYRLAPLWGSLFQ